MVRGTTRLCQIVGHPIAQVQSPALFNAATARLGLDVALLPVDVAPADLAAFVAFGRVWRNSAGFIVTVPHKRAVAAHLDALTPRARRLGAVNVVRREADGRLLGDMLDGVGFMAAAAAHGFRAAGRSVLVVGTGGAGSAIVDALCEAGVARLAVRDLDPARVEAMRALVAGFPGVAMADPGGLDGFDLVVNASPAGMDGHGALPVDEAELAALRPGTLVADVVTKPAMTPFLLAAQARGCRVQTGAEMAAGQVGLLGRFMGVLPEDGA